MKKSEAYRKVMFMLGDGRKRDAARYLWPWFTQNEWTDKIWNCIEENKYLAIMGHGSASKTFTSAAYMLLEWWSDPENTAVIVTSATIGSMRGRIWSDIKILHQKTRIPMPGILIDSKYMIQHSSIDGKNCIMGVAAESNDSQTKIQGLHTKKIRVIFDEADNKYSRSIWEAVSNLGTAGELKVVALANPINRIGEFGLHCEPSEGWNILHPETAEEWKSRMGYHVLRLDGLKSPNIKAGIDRFPFLLTNQGLKDVQENKGTLSREWWSQIRAWYPPEGTIKSIFTPDIIQCLNSPFDWYSSITPIAACDPAFEGGDNCILALGHTGRMAKDPSKTGIKITKFIKIKRLDDKIPLSIDFANQIIAQLTLFGVKPNHFAVDSTGAGGPFADIIEGLLGSAIMRVCFSQAPTQMKITSEDSARPEDRFDRFVSELWFVAREWVRMRLVHVEEQSRDLRIQLESRTYEMVSKNKISVESKSDMKDRGLPSPDEADTLCIAVHLSRTLAAGFVPSQLDKPKASFDPMARFRKQQNSYDANYGVKEVNAH